VFEKVLLLVHFEVKSIEAISCVLICFPCSGGGGGGITHTQETVVHNILCIGAQAK
jgi:hypothetical protein